MSAFDPAVLHKSFLWQPLKDFYFNTSFSYEPRHEKTCFAHAKTKDGANQLRGNRVADQRLWFRCKDSVSFLFSITEILCLITRDGTRIR